MLRGNELAFVRANHNEMCDLSKWPRVKWHIQEDHADDLTVGGGCTMKYACALYRTTHLNLI